VKAAAPPQGWWAWRLLAPEAWTYAWGLPMLLVTDVGALWLSDATGRWVDALRAPPGPGALLAWMAAIALAVAVARGLWRLAVFGAARRIEADWRQRLATHWLGLPAEGLEAEGLGARLALLTGDVQALRAASGEGVMAAFDGAAMGLLSLAYLVHLGGWALAAVAVAPMALMLPLLLALTHRMGPAFTQAQEAYGRLSERVQEAVMGIRVIKGFGAEAAFLGRLEEANQGHRRAQLPVWRVETALEPIIRVAIGLSYACTLAWGGLAVAHGQLSLGQLVAAFATLSMMAWPLHACGWALGLWAKGRASWHRLQAQLAQAQGPLAPLDWGGAQPPSGPLGLQLEALSWWAPGSEAPSLGPLTLALAPGEWLGVFGPVGAGKSLLLELLARWRDPSSGRVLLGGVPLTEWPWAQLRARVAVVAQGPHLLARSLRENLALRPGPQDEAALWAALAQAQLHEELGAWPEGLDTFLGERGRFLSGGQRQRLEVARTLLARPDLALLDDPFSALDAGTEARLRASLRQALPACTVVLVAHRTAALAHCDRILVLEGGRAVAVATHQELLQQGGAYAEVHALERARSKAQGGRHAPS
jgi:ATP-binding cassette subfamily B multidrug efflux pump